MSSVVPYLSVSDAAAAIDFYVRAFDAREILRMTGRDGRIGHAELSIGGARIMLADEWPEGDVFSPEHYGGSAVSLVLNVPDVDSVFATAVAAGAIIERGVSDQFRGDRSGWVVDPFGHRWNVGTKTEGADIS